MSSIKVLISLNGILCSLSSQMNPCFLSSINPQFAKKAYQEVLMRCVDELFGRESEPFDAVKYLTHIGMPSLEAEQLYHQTMDALIDAITAFVPDLKSNANPGYQYTLRNGCDLCVHVPDHPH